MLAKEERAVTIADAVRQRAYKNQTSKDISGKEYGLLTALERTSAGQFGWSWKCFCRCGNSVECLFNQLESGHSVCCGAACVVAATVREKASAKNKEIKRLKAQRNKYFAAPHVAARRGLEFNLTERKFNSLRNGKCEYGSGKRPEFHIGIDRKDNLKGYVDGNVVSCCPRHNSIKSDVFSHKEMLDIVKRYPFAAACGSTGSGRNKKKAELVFDVPLATSLSNNLEV